MKRYIKAAIYGILGLYLATVAVAILAADRKVPPPPECTSLKCQPGWVPPPCAPWRCWWR